MGERERGEMSSIHLSFTSATEMQFHSARWSCLIHLEPSSNPIFLTTLQPQPSTHLFFIFLLLHKFRYQAHSTDQIHNPHLFVQISQNGMVFGKIDVETPKFEVIRSTDDYEIRQLPFLSNRGGYVRSSPFNGNKDGGFTILANYIGALGSPQNAAPEKIAMTAPVITQAASEKIAMTAPVVTTAGGRRGREEGGDHAVHIACEVPEGGGGAAAAGREGGGPGGGGEEVWRGEVRGGGGGGGRGGESGAAAAVLGEGWV